jgi:hypothetical protein
MSIFPKIEANQEKLAEQATKEKIRKLEGIADDLLAVLRTKDICLGEAAMILKVASDKLNRKGSELKIMQALGDI